MKVISISNQKGGVGKTTITVNLAAELAKMGLRVLVLDMDEQCDTTGFYCGNPDIYSDTVYTILTEGKNAADCSYEVEPNLHIIPGSTRMKFFDSDDEGILKRALDSTLIHDNIDVVLIDNPPAINNKTLNSFTASDYILIITEAEKFSVEGLKNIESNIKDIRKSFNPSLEIIGYVVNKVDQRRKLNRQYLGYINDQYKELVFNEFISNYSEIPRSNNEKSAICNAYPKSKSAVQFKSMALELANRLGCEVKYGNARFKKNTVQ